MIKHEFIMTKTDKSYKLEEVEKGEEIFDKLRWY